VSTLDIIQDGFSEDQFFAVAPQLVEALYHIASSDARPNSTRSLAVEALRTCMELLEMVKEDNPTRVEHFASQVVDTWTAFFHHILERPVLHLKHDNEEEYNGLVSLKLQIYKVSLSHLLVGAKLKDGSGLIQLSDHGQVYRYFR
jgi:importin-9